jgi:phosphoglycolate phosphatase
MYKRIRNILFDMDGTLIDPKEGILHSLLHALEKLGIEEKHPDELTHFIGPPLRDIFASRYKLSDNLTEKAVLYYREYYAEKGIHESKLYNGIPQLLDTLFSMDYQLFVATSKPTLFAAEILTQYRLEGLFKGISGSSMDRARTGKTEIISHVLSSNGLQPAASAMVGDRKHDIIGARNNGLKAIGISYGYGTEEEWHLHPPDDLVKSPEEIINLFAA